jgi:hypothetical protein
LSIVDSPELEREVEPVDRVPDVAPEDLLPEDFLVVLRLAIGFPPWS